MEILKAERADLAQILIVQKLAFQREAQDFNDYKIEPLTQTLETLQKEYDTYVFLKALNEDGDIIGSCRGYIDDGTSYVGKTFVHPDYQGVGIGTKLITAMEKINLAKRYEINSSIRCPKNIRLYEELGYVRFKETRTENNGFVYLEKLQDDYQKQAYEKKLEEERAMQYFLTRPQGNTEQERNDKADILELLNFERYCRDNELWDEMRKCFSPDSVVDISWYQGSGDGFVTASAKLNRSSEHMIHNSLTWVNENRAVTVMIATIQMRSNIDGVECELSTDVQLHFCTEKIEGRWYIARFESIYEKDRLIPVLPDSTLSISSEELAKYRKSYACMSFMAEKTGMHTNQELVGTDRPDMMLKMRERLSAWLAEGKTI